MPTLTARFALLALLALLAACAPQRTTDGDLAAPRSRDEWTALLNEVRAFERRIGFNETRNFLTFAQEKEGFPFCGYVSRLYLPYSYEDPAIRWTESASEEECRAFGEDLDVSYGETEAVGEQETPVTASMLAAPLDRLLYLVIHEDCHDQFELPYGIEEPVCNVIAYGAMARFSDEKFAAKSAEREVVRRYVGDAAKHSLVTIGHYERLAGLYAGHARNAISLPVLLAERERIFRQAERELAWPEGTMNNVWLANTMTYSRHYPAIERVFEALGRDVPRTVAFFRTVDAAKPTAAAVVKKYRLKNDSDLDFVRAYEAAVIATMEQALAQMRSGGKPRRAF